MTWCDEDYGYKKTISIDPANVAGNEVNFPILIAVTDADLADTGNGGHVQSANGYDIKFTTSTCTVLKHEIEMYINTTGAIAYWVRIPSLSSTVTTIIHMYYGKAGVVVDPSSTDVWDANFVGVFHMGDTAGVCADSTSNGNDGTYGGDLPTRITGSKCGWAQDFDGAGDNLNLPIGCHVPATGTYEIQLKSISDSHHVRLIEAGDEGLNRHHVDLRWDVGRHDINWKSALGQEWVDADPTDPDANDNYYVVSFEAGDCDWFQNNTNRGSSAINTGVFDYDNFWIGSAGGTAVFYEGEISEIRISDIKRSDNWLETTYNTQTSPGTFLSFGAEEEVPVPNTPPDEPDNPSPGDFEEDIEASPDLTVDVSDDDADAMDVTFYDAEDDSVIGTDSAVASGGTATIEWADLEYETVYRWYAIADDGEDTTQSPTWQFTTGEEPIPEPSETHFTLRTSTVTVYMSMPEWDGEEKGIDKNIDVINAWTDEVDVIDKDKKSEPLILTGVETGICFDSNLANRFKKIWGIQNRHEEVTITGLGDCMNGVYIIRSFHFETIPGNNHSFRWSMSLEFVRGI